MAAAPAPLNTTFTSSIFLPTISSALSSAGAGDDGGAVLIVVEDRDLHGLPQLLFDVEALRRLDVLQVDAAEGGLQHLAGADDFLGIFGGQLDIEDVDIGEALEQHALAFHDRLAGQGADVAQAQHRRAVAHHRHQVALGGVLVGEAGIALDLQARNGHAGRIGQAQIALRLAGLGRGNRHLSRRRCGMVFQCIFRTNFHGALPFKTVVSRGARGAGPACRIVSGGAPMSFCITSVLLDRLQPTGGRNRPPSLPNPAIAYRDGANPNVTVNITLRPGSIVKMSPAAAAGCALAVAAVMPTMLWLSRILLTLEPDLGPPQR